LPSAGSCWMWRMSSSPAWHESEVCIETEWIQSFHIT
jgi:hypothetical protein